MNFSKLSTNLKPDVLYKSCSFRFKKVPTFPEFVDFLLSTEVETYNEHWLPYYLLCTPCHLNYTVIAKTEDIYDDSRSLMRGKAIYILMYKAT